MPECFGAKKGGMRHPVYFVSSWQYYIFPKSPNNRMRTREKCIAAVAASKKFTFLFARLYAAALAPPE